MRIYVTGDVHGMDDYKKLKQFRDCFRSELTLDDYLIICGDFGILWDGGKGDEYMKETIYRDFPCTVLWIDGNHENFDALYRHPVEDWCGGKVHRITPKILHLMRGEIYTLGKDGEKQYKIFAFGGAKSIDRGYDSPNQGGWWREELPTVAEIVHGLCNLAAHNYTVDYIFTHDCPLQQYREMFKFEFEFTSQLNYYFDEIARLVDFKHWFFGHYHEDKSHGKYHCLYNKIIEITTPNWHGI